MIDTPRAPSRCGCEPHCALHEAAGPVAEIDCVEAAIIRVRSATWGIEREISEAADTRSYPSERARACMALRATLADLKVATSLVDAFARGAVLDPRDEAVGDL